MSEQLVVEKYKQTEVGLIPSDWEVKPLGEIAFVNMGQSPLSTYYNSQGIGLPLVQGNADVENRKTIIRFYTSMITKRGKIGDIIMSVRAPVGEVSKAIFDCCLGRGVCSISFDNEYIYQYLIFFEKSWAKLSTGSTFDSVNSKQVKELQIPIPPTKAEQTAIANALSDADALISSLEKLIAKKRNIKQGAMQQLLQPKEGWEVKKLREICEFSSGTAHENFIDETGDYVVVNSKFISTNGEVRKYANSVFCPVKIGDILIVLSDVPNGKAIAKCFLVDKDNFYTVNQRIGIIKPLQNISSEFLHFLINRHPYLLAFDDGAKQTNLRNQDVTGLPVCIPKSKEEQSRIATILSDMDAEIEALETKLEKYRKVKMGMMQNLLTGKIRLI